MIDRPLGPLQHDPVTQAIGSREATARRITDRASSLLVAKPRCSGIRALRQGSERGRSLMVGFNRRHAPGYVLAAQAPRDLIVLHKNRVDRAEAARTLAFDDFVHVVHTLRFLAPGPVEHVDVRARRNGDGLVEHLVLMLAGEGFTALGIMNRASGSTEQVLEVSGADAKRAA